jgi:hypothetical protein
MMNKYNYYVDYNHASDASTILWTDEDVRIEDCKPYIDFIRCDENGEEYQFLYSDENDFTFKINNFGAVKGNEEDEYIVCYTADFLIKNTDSKVKFFKALEFSNNEIEVVLGFMDSNDEILEDCFEESSNSITKLIEQP